MKVLSSQQETTRLESYPEVEIYNSVNYVEGEDGTILRNYSLNGITEKNCGIDGGELEMVVFRPHSLPKAVIDRIREQLDQIEANLQ